MKKQSIILFIVLSTVLSSQTWTNYDLKDLGIYDRQLNDLDIDSKQNIWFASISGLLKFDGFNWTVYDTLNSDITSNELYSVGIDRNDIIWCGLSEVDGVSVFDGENWIAYNVNNSSFDAFQVYDITFDKNNIAWIGTAEFLWRFENNSWSRIRHVFENNNNEVFEIELDRNNDIWFTTSYYGMFKYSNGNLDNYAHINPYYYDGLAIDSANNVWVFNNQNSLMHLNTISKEWVVRDTTETPISSGFNIPHTIIVDKFNNLWITEKSNLHHFNPETELWETYTAPDSLYNPSGHSSFTDFKLDANGNFWFITAGAGVFKLSDVITDVKEEQIFKNISIYPNPTNTLLTYETNNITSIVQQSIVDLSGKVIINNNTYLTTSNTINVSKLQSGVYFLQLTDMNDVKYSKKFVVE